MLMPEWENISLNQMIGAELIQYNDAISDINIYHMTYFIILSLFIRNRKEMVELLLFQWKTQKVTII